MSRQSLPDAARWQLAVSSLEIGCTAPPQAPAKGAAEAAPDVPASPETLCETGSEA
jgi:hypothetical protein